MSSPGSRPTDQPASGPIIVLVEPQLGENIGFAARAMLNCGLDRLRLVKPRDGWPSTSAQAAAAGATDVVDAAELYDSLSEAVADLDLIYAATARSRDLRLPTDNVERAAQTLLETCEDGQTAGVLFGPERAGLTTVDVCRAQRILYVPLSPRLSSLNLGQAVLIVAWEYCKLSGMREPSRRGRKRREPAARQAELDTLLTHLEDELDAGGFFRAPNRREVLLRDIRNVFQRAALKDSETKLLHGVVTALSGRRKNGELARVRGSKRPS